MRCGLQCNKCDKYPAHESLFFSANIQPVLVGNLYLGLQPIK